MTVKGVSHTVYSKESHERNKRGGQESGFSQELMDNLKAGNKEETALENGGTARLCKAVPGQMPSYRKIQEVGEVNSQAVAEAAVRHLTYAQSSLIQVRPLEGYTLKALPDRGEGSVYVEMKTEDGQVSGYHVDPLAVQEDSGNPVERIALESWKD